MSFCGLYCPNVIVFLVFVGCSVLMSSYFQFVGAPDAVNIYHFVWKLLSAIYKSSFIHSYKSAVSPLVLCLSGILATFQKTHRLCHVLHLRGLGITLQHQELL